MSISFKMLCPKSLPGNGFNVGLAGSSFPLPASSSYPSQTALSTNMYSILIKKIYIFLIEKQTRLFMGGACDKSNSSSRKANEKTKTKCHNRKLCVCLSVPACLCVCVCSMCEACWCVKLRRGGKGKRLLSCYNWILINWKRHVSLNRNTLALSLSPPLFLSQSLLHLTRVLEVPVAALGLKFHSICE